MDQTTSESFNVMSHVMLQIPIGRVFRQDWSFLNCFSSAVSRRSGIGFVRGDMWPVIHQSDLESPSSLSALRLDPIPTLRVPFQLALTEFSAAAPFA